MRCPRCSTPGALVGLVRVDCLNSRCPCFHAPALADFEAARAAPGVFEFAGDPLFEIAGALWDLAFAEPAAD